MAAVQAPIIPIVAGWIRQTSGTISLGQGVVSYGPPREALAALSRAIEEPSVQKYSVVDGLPDLKAALAQKLQRENGVALGSEHCLVVTAGGNMAFMNAVLAITDPGDEVILLRPFYFNHEMAVAIAGARSVVVDTDAAGQPDIKAIRYAFTERTRAVVTISPNNPTGAVYGETALRVINSLCAERGIYHIHDEAYEGFVFDGARHFSPGAIKGSAPHTISLFSLSKTFGMAGWRVGYMTAPAALYDSIRKIQDTYLICPPVVSQHLAAAALTSSRDFCSRQIAEFAKRREVIRAALAALGNVCQVLPADGAFYFFVKVRTALDSMTLAERLVKEYQVAVIPGAAFGVTDGCTLRLSYGALAQQTIHEALRRLCGGLIALTRECPL
ncbi:MAG: pyridoxal phosphate-dependent aminotransferase [Vicinamibacteria bacterium]|jgi:aspartate/methionine/tyrosine aminotransferase|nr:pyridoxal phosphate-dependent aminotransferase [Vicinamibacteria bacterium]